jgi:hypothetical protein
MNRLVIGFDMRADQVSRRYQVKARHAIFVALAAAVMLTSVAAAGSYGAKQRVMITSQAAHTTQVSPFVLTPLQAGTIKRDSGKLIAGSHDPDRVVMREGQEVTIADEVSTFKGKRGSFVTRYHAEWVEAGNGYNVASATWKVMRGTGQYAKITGGGRGGSVWNEHTDAWSSHMEGVLTLP